MNAQEKQQFELMIQEINSMKELYREKFEKLDIVFQGFEELMRFMNERRSQQLTMPLDLASMQAIVEGFRTTIIERLNVRDIYFQATQESPTENGQMRFYDDRTTQNMRICTTKGVFVGSVDLTAV